MMLFWFVQAQGNTIVRYVSPLPKHAVIIRDADSFHHSMFAGAVLRAYSDHLPLRLSPDVVWFTIAQGW